MKDYIKQSINQKLGEINPSLKEIYSDNTSKINEMVNQQNKIVDEQKKRKLFLSILEEAKKNGMDIVYNEEMSTDELEELARSIEV